MTMVSNIFYKKIITKSKKNLLLSKHGLPLRSQSQKGKLLETKIK